MKTRLKISAFFVILSIAVGLSVPAFAQLAITDPKQFIEYNPDGKKYEFVKYYLKALDYLYRNEQTHQALTVTDPKMLATSFSAEVAKRLTQENVNLRIARNLLKPYATINNRLMVKAVDIFTLVCDKHIELNNKEKNLIMSFINTHQMDASAEDSSKLIAEQEAITNERRQASLQLLVASMLVEKILVSPRQNSAGEFVYLGISTAEKKKLAEILKQYKGENFEGELREGQSFMEASVAQIRSVLANTVYLTIDK